MRLRTQLVRVILGSCGILGADPSSGEEAIFKSVLELAQTGTGPAVAGGTEADTNEFPASFYLELANGEHCSATAIGPKVIITAAHCIADKGKITVMRAEKKFIGTCNHPTTYTPDPTTYDFANFTASSPHNTSADWALCLMTAKVVGIRYDRVSSVSQQDRLGDGLLLSGFGCAAFSGISRTDYRFRTGTASVIATPDKNGYYTVTDGSAAVCPGDSGGATYRVTGAGIRTLAGINSRTDQATKSFIASLTSPAGQLFIKQWLETNNKSGAAICGIDSTDPNCF